MGFSKKNQICPKFIDLHLFSPPPPLSWESEIRVDPWYGVTALKSKKNRTGNFHLNYSDGTIAIKIYGWQWCCP